MKRRLVENNNFKSVDQQYVEITTILHDIYLKIKEYLNTCGQGESVDYKKMKESSKEGQGIIRTILSFFKKLQARIDEWNRIVDNKLKRNFQRINDNTEGANEDSHNIYNIRVGVRTPNNRLSRQTDDAEKNQVENLCDSYFENLKNLDTLMEPYINKGESINR
jgi:hypothetical protein